MASFVHGYFERKTLAELGYTFSGDDITTMEVQGYNLIASEINKLEKQRMKKSSKSPRKR